MFQLMLLDSRAAVVVFSGLSARSLAPQGKMQVEDVLRFTIKAEVSSHLSTLEWS